jgi:hypothetical protein
MDLCKLPAELAGERVAKRRKVRIAHDAAALRGAGNKRLDGERAAEQRQIGRSCDWHGNAHTSFMGSLDAAELGEPVKAHGKARCCVRAQHPGVLPVEGATRDGYVEAPVLLHSAAGKHDSLPDRNAAGAK